MAYSARIDELEKKFSENARRYFAPLANEYRKAGDLDRAIEICRAHLPQQPGHMSGHIVYGQALYESRQLDEAKTVFEAALALDPENLIALRHLGDIARDSSDPATARAWYMRVLDADPRNDDVAAMLAELDAAAAAAPPAESAPANEGASGWGDINPERAADGGAGQAQAEVQQDEVVIEPEPDQSSDIGLEPMPSDASVDEHLGLTGATGSAAKGQGDAPDARPGRPQPSLDQVLNDAFADADTQEMEAGSSERAPASAKPDSVKGAAAPSSGSAKREGRGTEGDAGALGESAFAEVDALFDEIASEGGTPPAGARAHAGGQTSAPGDQRTAQRESASSDSLFGDDAGADDSDAGGGGRLDGLETSEFVAPSRPEPDAPKPRRTTGSMAVSGLTTFEQPSDEDSSTRAAFVTETMAELYLQQGFTAEALDIYRQLFEQNPDDTSLRDRIAQLERGGPTSLSEAAVSSEVIQAARQRHAARPIRTARSFFGRLAGQHLGPAVESDEPEAEANEGSQEGSEPEAAPVRRNTPIAQSTPARRPTPRAEPRVTGSGIAIVSDLFGEAPVSEADEAAASMLASAFSAIPTQQQGDAARQSQATPSSGGSVPGATTSGRPTRAAGRELSLDQVFRDSENRQPRKSGPFSFDQFFSDGSQGNGPEGAPAPEQPESDEAQDPEGDLEQFTAWLEGLKRK